MKLEHLHIRKITLVLQVFLMLCWASRLAGTVSYYSIYALCTMGAMVCLLDNFRCHRKSQRFTVLIGATIASLLSFASVLANYPLFQYMREDLSASTNLVLNVMAAVTAFLGGIVVFYNIFICLYHRFPYSSEDEDALSSGKYPARVFLGVFGSLSVIYLIYLFFVVYPGNVTSDSIWQIYMIRDNNYSNHHPYWHTTAIRLCLTLGYKLFGDANAAAATFSFFQSLVMAACFAYAVVTLYQHRVPRIFLILTFGVFALLPHHITFSATVWKDVPFGFAMLAFVVSMFRIMRNVGRSQLLNYILFVISGIGVCIMRTNGLAAMAAAFAMLLIFFFKKCKSMLLPWLGILVVGWALTGPVLAHIGIYNENTLEGLSVPLPQVARVITNGGELTEHEYEMISTILDINEVPEDYTEECCDPIKDLIRDMDWDYSFLREHMSEFAKLWIDIGMRYPWEYVEAWVEETKGYWNGGYDYYIYAQYVSDNDFGMYMVEQDNLIHTLMKAYFTITRETVFFQPLQSIGFNVWILSMLCFLNMAWGRREFLLTMPVVAVVFTLWLTTPVFSEFRYAYSVFTTLPFILPVSLCRKAGEEK